MAEQTNEKLYASVMTRRHFDATKTILHTKSERTNEKEEEYDDNKMKTRRKTAQVNI